MDSKGLLDDPGQIEPTGIKTMSVFDMPSFLYMITEMVMTAT